MEAIKEKSTFFTHEKSFYKRFFKMLLFIALQNVIVFSVNLADNIMLGNYNENALAGAALVNQIFFLLEMIVTGCGEGMILLNSQFWGNKDTRSIKKVCAVALRIAIGGAIILMAVTLIFPHWCLSVMTNNEAIIAEGVKYMRVLSFSFIVFAISNSLLTVLRSVEDVKIGTLVSLSTLFVNVFLNYCLIFGNFGFPKLGSTGAAIATLTSRCIELLIIVLYITLREKILKIRIKDLIHFDTSLFGKFIRAAAPAMVTSSIWGFAMIFQQSILGRLNATAANSVATTVFQILTVIVYGSVSASSVIIGKTVGMGDYDRVKQYTRTFEVIFLCFGLLTGLTLFLSRDFILTLFSDLSPETKALARQFMTVLSVTVVGTGYQVCVLGGVIKAGGSPKVQMINDMVSMWCIVLPLSLLAAYVWKFPPVVVFCFLKSDQVFKCGTAFVVCNRWKWIKNWVKQ